MLSISSDGEVPGTSRTDVKKAPQKPTIKPEGELVAPSSMMAPTPDYVAALGSEYGTGPRPLAYQDVPPGYNPQSVAMDTALTPLKIPVGQVNSPHLTSCAVFSPCRMSLSSTPLYQQNQQPHPLPHPLLQFLQLSSNPPKDFD